MNESLYVRMDNILKKASGAYDLELVSRLDISAHACQKKGLGASASLRGIEECNSLIELDLTGQKVDDLRPLSSLNKLCKLNLSSNKINFIEGLEKLEALEHLQLQGNQIQTVEDIEALSTCPNLKHLYLKAGDLSNPVCSHPSYTTTMLRKFPKLVSLDGERLKLKQSAQAALLESMAVPKAAFEVPESKPWLEKFDWGTGKGMLDTTFLEESTRDETAAFKDSLSEVKELEEEARKLVAEL